MQYSIKKKLCYKHTHKFRLSELAYTRTFSNIEYDFPKTVFHQLKIERLFQVSQNMLRFVTQMIIYTFKHQLRLQDKKGKIFH